jgi:hypothetical protein
MELNSIEKVSGILLFYIKEVKFGIYEQSNDVILLIIFMREREITSILNKELFNIYSDKILL